MIASVGSINAIKLICKTYFDKIEKDFFIDYKANKMRRIMELPVHVPDHILDVEVDKTNEEDSHSNDFDVEMNRVVQRMLRRNNFVNYDEHSDESDVSDEDSAEAFIEEVANYLHQLADGIEE